MTSTATAGAFNTPLSIKNLDELKHELAKLNKRSDWLLVSPNGQAYRGSPQDMMRVLIPFHPLMSSEFNKFETEKRKF